MQYFFPLTVKPQQEGQATLAFKPRARSENTKHVACINHIQIENNTSEKLPGVTIDSDLKFDIHVNISAKRQPRSLMLLLEFQDIWIQVRKEL